MGSSTGSSYFSLRMDETKWQPGYGINIGKMERCLLGSHEIQVPETFLEQKQIFKEVISQETWNKILSESQRQYLMTFLPKFPENDIEEKCVTLRRLFNGENFKFGNPLQKFHYQLKDGSFSPDIFKYSSIIRKVKLQDYRVQQQRYYHNLLKEILLSRQRVFDQLSELPPNEPIKFEYEPPKPQENALQLRVKHKYKRYLQEVRRESGVDETSSDDDSQQSPMQRSKKHLFKSLNVLPSPEPVVPSVHATYAAKVEYINGDIDNSAPPLKRARPITPPEVTEDLYKVMITRHRRRQLYEDYDDEEHPEFNTQNIILQDVMTRCHASRKGSQESDHEMTSSDVIDYAIATTQPLKVKREKGEDQVRKKVASKIRDMEFPEVADVQDDTDDDSITNVNIDVTEDDASTLDQFPVVQSAKSLDDVGTCLCFFSLLRNIILKCPDHRISSTKLEDRVREWITSSYGDESLWVTAQDDWVELVPSALKFLAGETIGLNVDKFIPYLDYKERAQQWHWIGVGRDSDANLKCWCDHWLLHKGDDAELSIDPGQKSPPPARIKTGYVVKTTSEEEKVDFRRQEKLRFENPHRAFMYEMHAFQSVVGPVKGVFSKKSDMTKAREHALLVSNRPAFVTILTLVRDAVARLPNGEGTRGDICELLKDSQFLAPGITDQQINVVVSGALDRLHSEKDPCVRYDVNRKVWIYLHRNRTEEEFERIHEAQAAAQKAKKSLTKPKTPKILPQKVRDMPSTPQVNTSSNQLCFSFPYSDGVNVEDIGQGQLTTQAQILGSPTLQESPRTAFLQQSTKVISRQSSASSHKSATMTQSLTPAQLQLLQQAAAAQAAHVKAQAEVNATKMQTQTILTKTQTQTILTKAHSQIKSLPQGSSPTRSDFTPHLQQVIAVNQGPGPFKVIPQTTSMVRATVQPNVTLQTQARLQQLQCQTPLSIVNISGESSPAIQVVTSAAKTMLAASAAIGSPGTVITSAQAGTNPLMAHLMQQMSAGGQMVSVSSLLAAQRSLQTGQPRATAAFKIQGGNLIQQVPPGKSVHLMAQPMAHAKSQLIQLGAKGQQTLGLIQTPQGTISIIPQQAGAAGTLVNIAQPRTSDNSLSQASCLTQAHIINQPKANLSSTSGMMVTQLASAGNITLRPGTQGKIIAQGQSGLMPAQLILQQTSGVLKTMEGQSTDSVTGATSLLVSSSPSTPQSSSLQMVRTMLAQQAGLKPGQATILISQPALQEGQVLPPGPLIQAREQGKTTLQTKQPLLARILSPQSNLNVRLMGGVQVIPTQGAMLHAVGSGGQQTISVQNEAVFRQTLSKLVSGSVTPTSVILTPVSSPSMTQQIFAAAAGKATQIRELEKEKKS